MPTAKAGVEVFDEYDEPVAMETAYCGQMSMEQFEEQTANATEQAVMVCSSFTYTF